MAKPNKTGGTTGTNQYQTRGAAKSTAAMPHLSAPLIADPTSAQKIASASSHRADPTLLDQLAADPDFAVRQEVALNPNTSTQTINEMCYDPHPDIAMMALHHRNCSPRNLSDAARGNEQYRQIVARHYASPREVLDRLVSDPDATVRSAVAARAKIDPQHAQRLATDAVPDVRMELAANPDCPPEIRSGMVNDTDEMVQYWATQDFWATA